MKIVHIVERINRFEPTRVYHFYPYNAIAIRKKYKDHSFRSDIARMIHAYIAVQ